MNKKKLDQVRNEEKQYSELFIRKGVEGAEHLGVMNSQVWRDDPRRLVFTLSRYKFVSKMFSGFRNVLEVGCGDAFCSRVVQQEVETLTVVDFDQRFIDDIHERTSPRWPMSALVHNILLSTPPGGPYQGIFCLDVLEHIQLSDEARFITNLLPALSSKGVLIVGMPSIESQVHASPQSVVGHVNCKTGSDLRVFLQGYFNNVFLFSMNDEVVHTGFSPMAHYLLAICCGKK